MPRPRRPLAAGQPAGTGAGPALHAGAPPAASTPRRDFLARAAAAVGGGLLALAGRPALPGGAQARAATAGFDPFIGEIMIFAGNFAPNGWAFCHGQILPIAQFTALFSLLGTTYGGNGVNTFALPDLRGRVPIQFGQGPGLPNFSLGEQAGEMTHTLIVNEMPAHSHAHLADDSAGTQSSPTAALPARDPSGSPAYGANLNTTMASTTIGPSGGSQPHNNMQPYLALNFCIALEGIYPPRS
jgi:microcystin-dependent protein